jgi:hypothetical protein
MTLAIAPEERLDAVLAPAHDAWVEEARQVLSPALKAGAESWERWPAVRWLNERFLQRFLTERAWLNELRPMLSRREEEMLTDGEDRIARLRLELDRLARRRGSAADFAAMAREFLGALELWCAEHELAVQRIQYQALSHHAQRVLQAVDGRAGRLHLL